jgi:ATP-dependent DNA helicase DinG
MVSTSSMRTSHELLSNPAHGLVREARDPQLQMAASIEKVLAEGGAYFCEAPVATGKTYAYLLPALLAAGRRVVVATAKKQLQDQIVLKDLPALKRVLGPDLTRALGAQMLGTQLKGKGNYACRLAAMKIIEKNGGADGGEYNGFLHYSRYGDRAEFAGMPPRWWGSASAEDCIGKKCDYFDDCGYIQLKRDVTQSKIVVVNHHVLGAEMFYGHGKMVGGAYDVLIVDEAHALAAGIRSAFTWRVAEDSISSLQDLLRRAPNPFPMVRRVADLWDEMFRAVDNRNWADASARDVPVFDEQLAKIALDGLDAVAGELDRTEKQYGGGDDEPEDLDEDALPDGQRFDAIEIEEAAQEMIEEEGKAFALAVIGQAKRRVEGLRRGLASAQGVVVGPLDEADPEGHKARILANTAIYSTQDERGRFGVNCAPVNVGGIVGRYFANIKTIVLCSATLAIDDRFDHITAMTGVAPAVAEVLPTSFDYAKQGFAFIPRGLPVIGRKHPDYEKTMRERVELAVKLVRLSNGGAFVLTTANDELDAFAGALKQAFPGRTFAQGHRKNPWDGDPTSALTRFKETPNSILVGSKSFWEGVDIPGGALRLVIMAKLPFPQYNDPIIKARERLAGPDAFRDVQLVDMLVDLRQGVGRLIRTRLDRGCVAILDSRVWEKSYGGMVRRALPWPNNQVTSDVALCERYLPMFARYFEQLETSAAASM